MENYNLFITNTLLLTDLAVRLALSLRVIMRKRQASVTLAWLVIILLLPFAGAIIYLLLGENRIGQKRAKIAASSLPIFKILVASLEKRLLKKGEDTKDQFQPVEMQALKVIGLPSVPGNNLDLINEAEEFFIALIKDINQAQEFCFLEFYIWEEGGMTDMVAEALLNAAARGITCKVLLDSIGSDSFLKSKLADTMKNGGIEIVESLPAGIFRALFVRIDLRNHRKIVVIDGKTAYTGSQNLVDPRFFKQDENLGCWIDTMVRVEGPVVETMTATFLYDWFVENDIDPDSIPDFSEIKEIAPAGEARVQLVPSGPGFEREGIHDLLLTTIYAARHELVLTTPYFVPDNAILVALKSAARRGVTVTIIVPKKSDSKLVHYASRARFGELTRSGVKIMSFQEGLLHSKTITVDNDFSLIGSVNLDMRSFWLNFELTMFVYNTEFTRRLRKVQQEYMQSSLLLDHKHFDQRSFLSRLKENCALIVGPLL